MSKGIRSNAGNEGLRHEVKGVRPERQALRLVPQPYMDRE